MAALLYGGGGVGAAVLGAAKPRTGIFSSRKPRLQQVLGLSQGHTAGTGKAET